MPSKPEAIIRYEEAKRLAFSGNSRDRQRLAEAPGVAPEILFKLSTDSVESVRAAVAENPDLPEKALPFLARDVAENVRLSTVAAVVARVGARIGSLSMPLTQALQALASDAAVHIRARLSAGLSNSSKLPAAIAERLARDPDSQVAVPVLHASPVITDAVLVSILQTTTDAAVRTAIASRDTLSAEVIDAILVDDLEVDMNLIKNPAQSAAAPHQFRAWHLYQQQGLTESVILEAIQQKDRLFLISALALLVQMREGKVKKFFALQGAKAITALAWKGGLSASAAFQLQVHIAGIPPRQALAPRHGDYALSPTELEWQLELFDSLVA